MTRIHKSLTLEKHNVSKVFVSREYLEQLGIVPLVKEAAETDNFTKVYEILIEDALETKDQNLLKIVTGEHIISVNEAGITFEVV